MGQVILDSSVLIALLKGSDRHHEVAVKHLQAFTGHISISVATLSEALVHAQRGGPEAVVATRKAIGENVARIHPIDEEIAIEAANLRSRFKLLLGDAFIGATSRKLRAELWTFDKTLAAAIPGAVLLR